MNTSSNFVSAPAGALRGIRSRMTAGAREIVAAATIAGVGCATLYFVDPAGGGIYPVCLLHKWTGLLCPGCGSLRAAHQLLHGNLLAALHLNSLFVLLLPMAVWLSSRWTVRTLSNQPVNFPLRGTWFWCALAALVAFGVVRNLPFAHAAWLAP